VPRKPRIEIAGYYHIINRGAEQRVIFKEPAVYGVIKRSGKCLGVSRYLKNTIKNLTILPIFAIKFA